MRTSSMRPPMRTLIAQTSLLVIAAAGCTHWGQAERPKEQSDRFDALNRSVVTSGREPKQEGAQQRSARAERRKPVYSFPQLDAKRPVLDKSLSSLAESQKIRLFHATSELEWQGASGPRSCIGVRVCTDFLAPTRGHSGWFLTPASCVLDGYFLGARVSGVQERCAAEQLLLHNAYRIDIQKGAGQRPMMLVENDLALLKIACHDSQAQRRRDRSSKDHCLRMLPRQAPRGYERLWLPGASAYPWSLSTRTNPRLRGAGERYQRYRIHQLSEWAAAEDLDSKARESGRLWLGPLSVNHCIGPLGSPVVAPIRGELFLVGMLSRRHCSPHADRAGLLQVTSVGHQYDWLSQLLVRVSVP